MIFALLFCLLAIHGTGPVEVWLFFYNPTGRVSISSEYCMPDGDYALQCFVPDGKAEIPLTISAPCSLDRVPVLVSEDWKGRRRSVHWEYLRNDAPCVHRQILPIAWNDYTPSTEPIKEQLKEQP